MGRPSGVAAVAVDRAQPHHVDAHAAVGRHLRRFQRVDAGGAAAVAQQDDRGGLVRARRHGRDLLGRRLRLVVQAAPVPLAAEGHFAHVDAVLRKQLRQALHDGVAHRRADCIWKPSMAADQRRAVQRRALGHLAAAGEGDQPDFDVLGQLAQEQLRRLLRGRQPGRLDVGHAHAERHVHRQHDRRPCPGQRHPRHRTRRGEQQPASRPAAAARAARAAASCGRPPPRGPRPGCCSARPACRGGAAARRRPPAAAQAPAAPEVMGPEEGHRRRLAVVRRAHHRCPCGDGFARTAPPAPRPPMASLSGPLKRAAPDRAGPPPRPSRRPRGSPRAGIAPGCDVL